MLPLVFSACLGLSLAASAVVHIVAAQVPNSQPGTVLQGTLAGTPLQSIAVALAAEMSRQTGAPWSVNGSAANTGNNDYVLGSHLASTAQGAFVPVGLVAATPMVLLGRATLRPLDADALLHWLRQEGRNVRIGYSNELGSASLQCALQLEQLTGVTMMRVANASQGSALAMLTAETADVVCDDALAAIPEVLAGNVKAYVVASDERLQSLWDVPSADEAGLPLFAATSVLSLYAPPTTSKEVVTRLNAALQKALATENLMAKFNDFGLAAFPMTHRSPAAHDAFIASDMERFVNALKAAGVTPPQASK